MDVRVGLWRKLSTKELMLLNCGVGEDSWESLDCKEIQPVHSKGDQFWVFIGKTDAKAETPILWPPHEKSWLIGKDPDAGRDWGQEEKGTRGWDGWMASPTWCTRVWVNSRSWWWTGRPGVLWFMASQRVRHDWVTELNWTEWLYNIQLKTSRGVLFLPPSDAYDRSFLYLPYTLIKLHYTKDLSDQASSLAQDWILLRRPRILASFCGSTTSFHLYNGILLSH